MKNVRIITIDEAKHTGQYKFQENAENVKFEGFKPDMQCVFRMEGIREDGKTGYSDLIECTEDTMEEKLTEMADLLNFVGVTPTGRLVFVQYQG